MKKALFLLPVFLGFLCCYAQSVQVIPQPASVTYNTADSLLITPETRIYAPAALQKEAFLFNEYLYKTHGFRLAVTQNLLDLPHTINLETVSLGTVGPEAYQFNMANDHLMITGGSKTGVFYGLLTLLQMMEPKGNNRFMVPSVSINDHPRFGWRGMHLDVCRHFFPVAFIKKYIDYLALHKMNTFHWHLTDDQGWRIAIEKYPLLTGIGGWRNGSMTGRYADHTFDTLRYGGFYTQAEIREVVAYADERHITVVPEIEMPGHALAALAAYPELGCTGGPYEVSKEWGVFEDVFCPGNEKVFTFMEDVLTEICNLFPGKYIHIGGDECPKDRWKTCPRCQKRMKDEGLKDEHELQSYFIRRIEKFLNGKGKQIIGWDEILEGGLAPNAAVMSWRGEEGGITAANQRHYVVMTPGSYCYFDHYQGNPSLEPVSIGGYTPLEKVYNYEPVPQSLAPELEYYIMGAQANLWTEYILDEKHVEYMAMPRMAALAEVLWTPRQNKDLDAFIPRLLKHLHLLDLWKVNYAQSIFQVKVDMIKTNGELSPLLLTDTKYGQVEYRIEGFENHPDTSFFTIDKTNLESFPAHTIVNEGVKIRGGITTDIQVSARIKGKNIVTTQMIYASKSNAKPVSYHTPPGKAKGADPGFTLVNGIKADLPRNDEQWLGWQGEDVEITIDLLKPVFVSQIAIGYLQDKGSWIWHPKEVQVLGSVDGKKYTLVQTADANTILQYPARQLTLNFTKKKTRYIKVVAKNPGLIPEGNPGAGNKSWLFFDEILID